jgi:hypothetical protein
VCLSRPGDHIIIPLGCDVSGNLGLHLFRDLHAVCGSLSTRTGQRLKDGKLKVTARDSMGLKRRFKILLAKGAFFAE